MTGRAPLATVASLSAVLLAAACSAPAPPPETSAGTAPTAAPIVADAGVATPAVTFTGGGYDAAYTTPSLGDGGVAGVCSPQPTPPPAATWIPPHALHRNVCTPQEAAAIVSCFVENQNCQVLVSSACHQCAVSGDTTPYSSALIVHDQKPGTAPELNIEGCVGAVAGDPSATGCGPKLAAKYQCAAASCAGCTDATGFKTCSASADTTTCATSNTAAQCAAPYMAQCVQGASELDVAFNLVKTFCGP